ncbi:hypothetical protein NO1_0345 [Candidatus Termititenax aidoneus]|uniref:Uncharacterized protein n=1 Tax=Termititenax aidoneus TaxID=2218524 RepID=A0A388TAZ1_TERA1|nr:hypothetical protein NO1_0345 [Candidatus Termititenax aidoneus]
MAKNKKTGSELLDEGQIRDSLSDITYTPQKTDADSMHQAGTILKIQGWLILSTKELDAADKKPFLDFCCGAVSASNGLIRKLTPNMFFLSITKIYSQDDEEKRIKNKKPFSNYPWPESWLLRFVLFLPRLAFWQRKPKGNN